MLASLPHPSKWIRSLLAGSVILGASVFAEICSAQEVQVKAELSGRRIAVGQSGSMIIQVINGGAENAPRSIAVEGLKVYKTGESGDYTNSNGTMQVIWQYFYNISGGKPGNYTIPSQKIRVLGKDYQTDPIDLVFYEPKQDDLSLNASQPYFSRLDLLDTDLYEFQIAPVELSVYVRGANTLDQISPPGLSDSDFIVKPFTRTNSAEIVDIDGWQYTRAKIQAAAFPIRSGERTLGPVDLKVRIVETQQHSNRIIRTVFSQKRSVEMASNDLKINVKPLPTEGRPHGFADTVGKFELRASASPTNVKVGDPISVEFYVTGVGNFDNVPAPTFQGDSQLWRTYEPRRTQDPTQTSDGIQPGRVNFTQIVIPQASATELPAFTMSYFDPETASYHTLQSEPVAVTIAADTPLSAAAAPAAADAGSFSSGGASQPSATFTDILTIRTTSSGWTNSLAAITDRWYFWLPQALPAAAVLLLFGGMATRMVRRRIARRSDPDSQEMLDSLLRRLRTEPAISASRQSFFQHLHRCLDAWRSERPEAESRLSAATAARLDEIEKAIHDSLYSGTATDRGSVPTAVELEKGKQLISELSGQQKKR